MKIAIIQAEFNKEFTDEMKNNAIQEAKQAGAEIEVFMVPGVLEIALIAKKILQKEFQGVVCLGAVIQGGTAHDELVAENAVQLLSELSLEYEKPVGIGIIGPRANRMQVKDRMKSVAKHAVATVVKGIKQLQELQE